MSEDTSKKVPFMGYDELIALNNMGCYECPYLREPRLGVNQFKGLCALLDFHPCAYPQMFDKETRFNLPCLVYQEFIKDRQKKKYLAELKASRPKIHRAR